MYMDKNAFKKRKLISLMYHVSAHMLQWRLPMMWRLDNSIKKDVNNTYKQC